MEANICGIPTPGQFDVPPIVKRGVEWKEYLEDYKKYASETGFNNAVALYIAVAFNYEDWPRPYRWTSDLNDSSSKWPTSSCIQDCRK